MRRTGDVRWCASLAESPRDGTAAWIATNTACAAEFDAALAPNAVDLDEIGGRRGLGAERFLRRRLTLRSLVARWCDLAAASVVVGYGPDGRPEVRSPRAGPFCSVSARGDISAFALSAAPVGIDLEPVEAGEIASAVLSAGEQAALDALPEDERLAAFLELWTVKEAYLKALGSGLLRDPSALAVARRERTFRDGRDLFRLSTSAIRHDRSGGQPLVAACVSLPGSPA